MSASGSYGRGAAVLSIGIGVTGLVTYAYFALASHALPKSEYGGITLLWSAVFIVASVLYRPVEQLLSRTIAERRAQGRTGGRHLRVAATIQLALAGLFAAVALALRHPLEHGLFNGSAALYWILIGAVLAYAASYFARGFLAGNRRFGLYGGLVLMESACRFMFALAVAVGIAAGQTGVALGILVAPLVSLVVVPWALGRRLRAAAPAPAAADPAAADTDLTLAHGAGFALAVLAIMLSEQTFLNAGPLVIKATEHGAAAASALAGFAFNVLLIARAPLQLFQAVQTSILPHLTGLRVMGAADPFRRSVNVTLGAIAAFAGVVALVMAAAGPPLMRLLFGGHFGYPRGGLVMVSLGMGLYLAAATLNQAALAQARARQAATMWAVSAAAFVVFLVLPGFDDRVLQLAIGYLAAAALLCSLLFALYRRER